MLNFLKLFGQVIIEDKDLDIPTTVVTKNTVPNALQIVFGVMGVIAMLIIVIAGLQFSLSRGNPEKAGKARNAIIYAAIGLGISLVAFSIVRFVIGRVG